MAANVIKATFKATFDLDKRIKGIRRKAKKALCKTYKESIIEEMLNSRSPVKRKRWRGYSSSYLIQILEQGRIRGSDGRRYSKEPDPVNLKVSGKLHKSLNCVQKGRGVEVRFEHFLADIHNSGASYTAPNGKRVKIPKRRMLPTEPGEEFNPRIQKAVQKVLDAIAKRATR